MDFRDSLSLQSTVRIKMGRNESAIGIVRYFDKIAGKEGKWVGVELTEPLGNCEGEVDWLHLGVNGPDFFDQVRLFECKPKHGIFVHLSHVVSEFCNLQILSY